MDPHQAMTHRTHHPNHHFIARVETCALGENGAAFSLARKGKRFLPEVGGEEGEGGEGDTGCGKCAKGTTSHGGDMSQLGTVVLVE